MTRRVLVARLDGAGDVLLAGPAVRAVAAAAEVTVLCGPAGSAAAGMLPGVRRVLVWAAPWVVNPAPPVRSDDVASVVEQIRGCAVDEALVLTSFHQSPLPTALLLRLAGVGRIGGASVDHPGALLDVRLRPGAGPGDDLSEDLPEPDRALRIASAAGFTLPAGDDGRLAVRPGPAPPGAPTSPAAPRSTVVLHPGAAVAARRWPAGHFRRAAELLHAAGFRVLVTGSSQERPLTAAVAGQVGVDLGGETTFAQLAGVLAGAEAVVVGNTAAAHLAAAVGTPVVSLFAPVVPAGKWRPYRVPHVLLGDQHAACRDTRARDCPVSGHPCLSGVAPQRVLDAVRALTGAGAAVPA
jgi:ADP-heptose:LPS heptosyltransferase